MIRESQAMKMSAWVLLSSVTVGCGDEEPAVSTGPVDSGFRPTVNGFAFPNFGGADPNAELAASGMQRMFGDAVCISLAGDSCVLDPIAAHWMASVNASMGGGRCEGFAVLSQLFFLGEAKADTFGAAVAHALTLETGAALGGEIAYWYATQNLQDVATETTVALDGREAIAFLRTALAAGADVYRMGLVRVDADGVLSGGHAITPYAIEEGDSPGLQRILVYDNNHPGEARSVLVDLDANRWEYRAATNPENEEGLFYGDAANQNPILFTPTRPRLGVHPCPFCPATANKPGDPLRREVRQSGGARLMVSDGKGGRIGVDTDGRRVVEMEGAELMFGFSGPSVIRDELLRDTAVTPVLGRGYAVTVAIDAKDATQAVDAQLFGPGYVAGALGVVPGSVALSLAVSGDGSSATLVGDAQGASLHVAIATDDGVVEATAQPPKDAAKGLTITVDPETTAVAVSVDSATSVDVLVTVSKTTPDAPGDTFDGVVTLDVAATTTLLVSDWDGGDAMPAEVDTDGDGTADQTIDVPDCGDNCPTTGVCPGGTAPLHDVALVGDPPSLTLVPAGATVEIDDTFDDAVLDPSRWRSSVTGATLTVEGGQVVVRDAEPTGATSAQYTLGAGATPSEEDGRVRFEGPLDVTLAFAFGDVADVSTCQFTAQVYSPTDPGGATVLVEVGPSGGTFRLQPSTDAQVAVDLTQPASLRVEYTPATGVFSATLTPGGGTPVTLTGTLPDVGPYVFEMSGACQPTGITPDAVMLRIDSVASNLSFSEPEQWRLVGNPLTVDGTPYTDTPGGDGISVSFLPEIEDIVTIPVTGGAVPIAGTEPILNLALLEVAPDDATQHIAIYTPRTEEGVRFHHGSRV